MTPIRRRAYVTVALFAAAAVMTGCGAGAPLSAPSTAKTTPASQQPSTPSAAAADSSQDTNGASAGAANASTSTSTGTGSSSGTQTSTGQGSTQSGKKPDKSGKKADQPKGNGVPKNAAPITSVIPAGVADEAEFAGVVSADGTVECVFFESGEGACGIVPAAKDGRFGRDVDGSPVWVADMTQNGGDDLTARAGETTLLSAFKGKAQVVKPGEVLYYKNFVVIGQKDGMIAKNLDDNSRSIHFTSSGGYPVK